MKQFLVLCAVLPLMLIIMIQFSLDQINSSKINAVNQAVYSAKERAQMEGYFTNDIKDILINRLKEIGFSDDQIETEYDPYSEAQDRGTLLNYRISVLLDKAFIGLMVKNNSYYYTIDTCTVSEYLSE